MRSHVHLSGIGWYHLAGGNQIPDDVCEKSVFLKGYQRDALITAVLLMIKVISSTESSPVG